MERSLLDENARLRALLDAQQQSLHHMAEYNRQLSLWVAAYASEINRLKALVIKLQRMQFGKSSEKLRQKTERQLCDAQDRISALQEAGRNRSLAKKSGGGSHKLLWSPFQHESHKPICRRSEVVMAEITEPTESETQSDMETFRSAVQALVAISQNNPPTPDVPLPRQNPR